MTRLFSKRGGVTVVFVMCLIGIMTSGAVDEAQVRNSSGQRLHVPTHVSEERIAKAYTSGDCHRCHQIPDQPPTPRLESCTNCHLWIKDISNTPHKRAKAMELFPLWERYEENVSSYLEVPSLRAGMARLKPEWVMTYLKDPHDVRPHLPESMPRFAMTEADIEAIGYAVRRANATVSPSPAPDVKNVRSGRKLFEDKGCVTCHTLGGEYTSGLPMAPDLQYTRERMTPDMVVAWILDPKQVSDAATMTHLGLTPEEAVAIRDFLFLGERVHLKADEVSGLPQATKRPVRYAEVRERVFGKICVHCHMNPSANEGRAGPGNAGGFGWQATGIELETYEGIRAVADKLPDALLRRMREAPRDWVKPGYRAADLTRPEKPGMPLGLPPLSREELSLVLGWIEQGMPR